MRRGTEHDRGVERSESVWNGANLKRRRRSRRWERGTRERVARGGVRLLAGTGGYFHEGRETIHGNAQKAARDEARRNMNLKAGGAQTRRRRAARPGSSPERHGKGMWIRNRKERTGRAAAGRAGSFNPYAVRVSGCIKFLYLGMN